MSRLFSKFVFDTIKRLYEAPLLLVIEACKKRCASGFSIVVRPSGTAVPGIASVYEMCAKVPIRPCLGIREREIGRYRST
jgi:hypothetical protein